MGGSRENNKIGLGYQIFLNNMNTRRISYGEANKRTTVVVGNTSLISARVETSPPIEEGNSTTFNCEWV